MPIRNLIILLCVFMAISHGCIKNHAPSAPDNCKLPKSTNSFGYIYQIATKNWKWAVFNPINNDEIIYSVQTPTVFSRVYKANIKNPADTFFLAGDPIYYPSMNKNSWIVLGDIDGGLYKIKSNRDSLMKFQTFTGLNFGPDWSPDGKKIIFSGATNSNYAGLFIMNADGSNEKSLDSIKADYASWSPDGSKIAFSTDSYIGILDTFTKQNKTIISINSGGNGAYISWFPDSKWIIYTTEYGMYKLNIETRQNIEIRQECEILAYGRPQVSADGKKIMVTRVDQQIKSPNTKYSEFHIYMMDADGSNETLVDLK